MVQTLCHQACLKTFHNKQVHEILKKYYADQEKGVQTSVNAFLVNTGKSLVLVDSGAASCFGAHLGSVLTNLKASGYQPEQVDTIYSHIYIPIMSVESVKMALPISLMRQSMYLMMKQNIG